MNPWLGASHCVSCSNAQAVQNMVGLFTVMSKGLVLEGEICSMQHFGKSNAASIQQMYSSVPVCFPGSNNSSCMRGRMLAATRTGYELHLQHT